MRDHQQRIRRWLMCIERGASGIALLASIGCASAEPEALSTDIATVSQPQSAAAFEGLGHLSKEIAFSYGQGVSADGSVAVGSAYSTTTEAVRWQAGSLVGLGAPADGFSEATAASGDGSVVVGVSSPGNLVLEAVRWQGGAVQGLGDLPGGDFFSIAFDVSSSADVIVGRGSSDSGAEAFRWQDGVMESIEASHSEAHGVSADGSVVVGYGPSAGGEEAFRWEAGKSQRLGVLPGHVFSVAYAVSDDGAVVVGYSGNMGVGVTQAFRWEDGVMKGLGVLPGRTFSYARSVTADGSRIVGHSSSMTISDEAFLWTESDGLRALAEVLVNDYGLDLAGWALRNANAISADGSVIVGTGVNPNGDIEAWRVSGLATSGG